MSKAYDIVVPFVFVDDDTLGKRPSVPLQAGVSKRGREMLSAEFKGTFDGRRAFVSMRVVFLDDKPEKSSRTQASEPAPTQASTPAPAPAPAATSTPVSAGAERKAANERNARDKADDAMAERFARRHKPWTCACTPCRLARERAIAAGLTPDAPAPAPAPAPASAPSVGIVGETGFTAAQLQALQAMIAGAVSSAVASARS